MEEQEKKKEINRRDFLKIVGISAATTTVALAGCAPKNNPVTGDLAAQGEIPTDKMTYRTNPKTGEKVSILGYGCMRWPTLPAPDGNGNVINQEEVNRLIDYAIEHGVNYFDTSPVYVQGWSEKSTGIALKRHPREKFLIVVEFFQLYPGEFDGHVPEVIRGFAGRHDRLLFVAFDR